MPAVRPSKLAYDLALKKLRRPLAAARPDDFMRLLWALDALTDGRRDAARKVIANFPAEAGFGGIDAQYAVHRWELETLATEYLITPPERPKNNRIRCLDVRNFNSGLELARALRNFENIEAGRYCNDENIFQEIARICQRQFPWQRGYLNKANFYRSAFLYGQGVCKEHFVRQHGLSPNDLSVLGFSFNASTVDHAGITGNWDLSRLGVTPAGFQAGLRLISAPVEPLRALARGSRVAARPIAYQACPLRQFPMVRFPEGIVAPIRDLILQRTTSGMYYDLVGAGGAVLTEIGSRFETYAAEFFDGALVELKVGREITYGTKARPFASPDLRLRAAGRCRVLVECKATKMTLAAQFGERPVEEAERGFGELSKGVYQIWRYCSHIRRRQVDDALADDPVGLLLTLDHWAMMSSEAYAAIIAGAERLADDDGSIAAEDRIPIAVSSMDDVELTLMRGTDQTFVRTLHAAAKPEKLGWLLPSIQQDKDLALEERNSHPFANRLGEVLPWWELMAAEQRSRGLGD